MYEALQQLDHLLASLRPEYHTTLNKPLSSSEIDNLEKKYKVKLPSDLRAIYNWKNGQNSDSYEAFVNNSMFLPLNSALEIAAENTSMIGVDFEIENWWSKNWIPIFDNGAGNLICYDLQGVFTNMPGQIIEFWHEENDRNIIAPNLKIFIDQINIFYSAIKPSELSEGNSYTPNNIEHFPKKFIVTKLLSKPAKKGKQYFGLKEGKPSKFWEIKLIGKNITTYTGKIEPGAEIYTNDKKLATKEEAEKEYEKLIRYSVANGFAEKPSSSRT